MYLSFSSIEFYQNKNPFKILIKYLKNGYPQFEEISILKKEKSKSKFESINYILDRFDEKEFSAISHNIKKRIVNSYSDNLDIDKIIANEISKYVYDTFYYLKEKKLETKIYIKHKYKDNSIRNNLMNLEFITPKLSFDFFLNENNQYALGIKLNINNILLDNNNFDIINDLIVYNNNIFLLNSIDLNQLKTLRKIDTNSLLNKKELWTKKILLELEKRYVVEKNNLIEEEYIDIEPINQILIQENSGFLMLTPQWKYQNILVQGIYNYEFYTYSESGKKIIVRRKKDSENQFVIFLKSYHKDFINQNNGYCFLNKDKAILKNWFLKFYHSMLDNNVDVIGMDMLKTFRYSKEKIYTKIKLIEKNDNSLIVEVHSFFGDQTIDNIEIKKSLINNQNSILLNDNSIGVIDNDWLEIYSLIYKHSIIDKNLFKVPKWIFLFQSSLIDINISKDNINIEHWKNKWDHWLNSDEIIFKHTLNTNVILRPYQQKGFEWFVLLDMIGAGACLADDMGLGKTLQTICFLKYKIDLKKSKKHLIICPASLMYNWKKEIEKFAPSMIAEVYHSNKRDFENLALSNPDIIITSYNTARIDINIFSQIVWNTIVLDESHNIKNYNALVTKALSNLNGEMKLLLTGTPILNNTLELYSQLDFILPSMFSSYNFFAKEYAFPIDRDRDKQKIEQLKKLTAPFILRRTKEAVAKDLPEKIESFVWCNMKSEQKKIYIEVFNKIKNSIFLDIKDSGLSKNKLNVLAGIQKLRKICSLPTNILDIENKTNQSVKIDFLLEELTDNLKENKVIIFSQFLDTLEEIKNRLKDSKINFYSIDGSTPNIERQQLVDNFQNDDNKVNVFLLSLKAGNVGLTLTKANYVFVIDPWWNKNIENQAIDRTYRIGQINNVFAYRLICKDTIEEKIVLLQERKKSIADSLIDEDSFVKNLTEIDLEFLFSS